MKKWIIFLLVLIIGVGYFAFFKKADDFTFGSSSRQQGVDDPVRGSPAAQEEASGASVGTVGVISDSADLSTSPLHFQSRADRVLPTETRFLRPGGVSVNVVGAVINGRGFIDAMNSLEREMLNDVDALEVRDVYREGINQSLETYDQLRLNGLACGLSICLGRISGRGEEARSQYQGWLKSLDGPYAPRTYAFMDAEYETDGPIREFRVVFSTDPGANALVTDGVMP